jgi:hypothetical protein
MLGTKKIILALTCFLLMIAYFGSTDSSAGSPSAPTDEAAVFFTPQRGGVTKERATFTHGRKEHAGVNCNACHRVTTQQVDVVSFPGHAACAGCHNFAGEYFRRGVAFCGICHTGPSRTQLFDFQDKTRRLQSLFGSDFGIDFSHPDHRKPLPANFQVQSFANKPAGISDVTVTPGEITKCTDCHKLIQPVPVSGRELSIEKGHSTCFQCHGMRPDAGAIETLSDGKKFPYMNDCRECHEIGAPKGAKDLVDIAEFRHADHEYDIRPRKKVEYRVKRPADFLCAECHKSVEQAENLSQITAPTDENCAACHNGRIGQPDVVARNILDKLRNSR